MFALHHNALPILYIILIWAFTALQFGDFSEAQIWNDWGPVKLYCPSCSAGKGALPDRIMGNTHPGIRLWSTYSWASSRRRLCILPSIKNQKSQSVRGGVRSREAPCLSNWVDDAPAPHSLFLHHTLFVCRFAEQTRFKQICKVFLIHKHICWVLLSNAPLFAAYVLEAKLSA